jgi:predicted glycoside hydrolase/deacetylase ChbG (UPF0249 family)
MRTTLLFLTLALAVPATAQEIRLIVQADDLGAGHGINVAAIEAYKRGIVRTANVLMPSGWVPEAAKLLNENPGLEAGIHLTVTSEWSTVKWRPLTLASALADSNGYFYPLVRSRAGAGNSVADAKPPLDVIEKELRAQIDLAKKMMPHVSYATAHMGFTSLSPEVAALVQRLCREYSLISPNRAELRSLGQVWVREDSAETRASKLAAKLESIGAGTWFMIEHPATDTPEIQSFADYVAADRSAVLKAWTHASVLAVVAKRGIKLTSHREQAGR